MLIFLFLIFFKVDILEARPLSLLPEPKQASVVNLLMAWRTDLWTQPLYSKDSPLRTYDVRFGAPVFKNDFWSLSLRTETEGLSSGRPDLVVGQKRVLIGSDLRTQSFGLDLTHFKADGSWYSLSISADSSSDEPFKNKRDYWNEMMAIWALPQQGDTQWVFVVNDSQNRGYLNGKWLLEPGFFYRPQPGLVVILGIPFVKVILENSEDWTSYLSATWTGYAGEISRQVSALYSVRARAGESNRSYLHENRQEDDMRLFLTEKYVDVGFRARFSENTQFEVMAGRSFDRQFYEAKQIYLDLGPRTNLPADFYTRFKIEFSL